jgi:hypothetical protein
VQLQCQQLESLLLVLKEECDKLGRDAGEVEISVGMEDCDLDTALRLQDMAVSSAVIAPRGASTWPRWKRVLSFLTTR